VSLHPLLMAPPYFVEYGGGQWTLVNNNKREARACGFCGKTIRVTARSYRAKDFAGEPVIYYHQKCLLGQIDPTVWDIAIPGQA
jgi:hypothetical protein